ncbi:Single-stranded-DNA-specific exonuclease RecJ [Candidatus Desulfarcum epimagneticum]|uniref:Single-stranded-DNA-specific exonuclease RecJ n=1 Tax=uncultured Desulfobacteraceae bacterium TaxID=218296 RepID=A0A484HDW1_9BACT|nr:Single-stranded-DNA-specific exonuclease RecJ [uncultured Desulfobacteraceae bacterium]
MKKNWHILQPDDGFVRKIQSALKCGRHMGIVLANRNMAEPEKLPEFINPALSGLRSPWLLKDMDKAVRRIARALKRREKILIFGDYDVDGVAATSILLEFLTAAGARVSHYIPHRIQEGYSLSTAHITDVAAPEKVDLIITVDCGISAHDAVAAAAEKGVDVVITDHHRLDGLPPPAAAAVNPKRPDCESGLDFLAGAGVALYVAIGLRKHLRDIGFWKDTPEPNLLGLCDLAALGTAADQVPMVDENRILTRAGIDLINRGPRTGLDALMKTSGIAGREIDSEDILFRLAPRLNAAGRMDHAGQAVDLLLSKDPGRARKAARRLSALNEDRKAGENLIFKDALERVRKDPSLPGKGPLVLSSPDWHEGIIGIVASRLAEKFSMPAILISTRSGIGKGSGRSVRGFDLYRALSRASGELERFGGHAMAAGFSIREKNIPRFRGNLQKISAECSAPGGPGPGLVIDCRLDFAHITHRLMNELKSLQPFGPGNAEPLFMAENVSAVSSKILSGGHRRMALSQDGGRKTLHAIHFNFNGSPDMPPPTVFEKIAFRLRWNRWKNQKIPQAVIEDIA